MHALFTALRTFAGKSAVTRQRSAAAAAVADILDGLRDARFDLLRTKYAHQKYAKYLDFERFVPFNVDLCRRMGLIDTRRQRILDLGCGSGLFLYCARYFGHEGIGVDIENELFSEMLRCLGIDRRIERIEPFKPLSPLGSFDLISCINTAFDRIEDERGTTFWGCKEWSFFLLDLERSLTRSGRVFLRINRGKIGRLNKTDYYDERLHRALAHGHLGGLNYLFDRKALERAIKKLEIASRRRLP